jgi:hypothetical protein
MVGIILLYLAVGNKIMGDYIIKECPEDLLPWD